MAKTNKTADGFRRLLQGTTLLGLYAALFLGIVAFAGRLSDHPLTAAKIIGVIVVVGVVLGGVAARFARRVPKATIVEVNLATLPAEAEDTSLTSILNPKKLTMRDTIEALTKAGADKRVAGVIVYPTFLSGGMAQIQELRDALAGVRAAGKFVTSYSEAYTNGSYYLATACDEILLQPVGDIGLQGLAVAPNFYKAMLDKAGIEIQSEGRWEYKSAADQITRTRMSKPFRDSHQRILDSQLGQIIAGVVARTGRTDKDVRKLIDRGPFLAEEAEKEGLVDALLYRDQAIERVKERAGKKSVLLDIGAYTKRAKRAPGKGRPAVLAVITATGGIVSRKQGVDPISGRNPMEADKVSAAIRKAVKDKRVKAIVLRVDSPGGSAIASETIWRETVLAKDEKKPVIVSMGDVAASGGYYISAAADRIVAHPGTITGSIGVISGKPIVGKAKRKLGVHPEELKTAANSALYSPNRPFNDSELERFRAGLDQVYDTFTSRVATGRGLTPEHVHAVARGRVWTGEDAHENGLVDALGGFSTAVTLAKQVAGVKPDAPVKLVPFPKKPSALARLRTPKRESSDDIAALTSLLAAVAQPLRRLAAELGSGRESLHCGLTEDDWLIR
ncbi:MAG TPA: signal peptide peptidase SppA [Acidimicrobiales bacterium]|nr:signal peptide peptidase SppA [Acidimicrobiales bacterium]